MAIKEFFQRFVLIAVCNVATASCVTYDDIDQKIGAWVGYDADTMVSVWGAPYGQYVNKNGTKTLTYRLSETHVYSSPGGIQSFFNQTSVRSYTSQCIINFIVDGASNKISKVNWQGDLPECSGVPLPTDNPAKGSFHSKDSKTS